ncbi:MAG TPA: hypothetical protein VGO37_05225, partial [Steroidobacteraceae bacterium]|nr:hypothetical protein [Steroidobacteraceae bacterium]
IDSDQADAAHGIILGSVDIKGTRHCFVALEFVGDPGLARCSRDFQMRHLWVTDAVYLVCYFRGAQTRYIA